MKKGTLSENEIKALFEEAEFFRRNGYYEEALANYDLLIEQSTPLPSYFRYRALVHDKFSDFDKSIDDIRKAILMDPGNADYYWELGGYLVSLEMVLHGTISAGESLKVFETAAQCYKSSLEKDPVSECAWINLIEVSLFSKNWDDAVCYFASCKSYLKSPALQLVRSFLGSLALIYSSEEIDAEDIERLNDFSIRISNDVYRACEIESFIIEQGKSDNDKDKSYRAKELLGLFLSHFNDKPRKYRSR